mgnify:CR=1 FL=1
MSFNVKSKNLNMKGLELIKKAIALQPAERVPWVPFVGVHGGFLTGVMQKLTWN